MLYSGNHQPEFGQRENSNGRIIYLQHGGPDKQHYLFTGERQFMLSQGPFSILMSTLRSIVPTTSLSTAGATRYSSVSRLGTLCSSLVPNSTTFGRTGELYFVCLISSASAKAEKWLSSSRRDKIWESMSQQERLDYLNTTEDKGNKRYAIPEGLPLSKVH